MAKVLNDAQIAQYRRDGYLFPFPALSAEELAACNAGLSRFERWLGKPVNQGDFRWRSGSYVFLP
jgi:non-haem Fe2+, alpha-ketoglutarate-dependent halogenase